MIAYKVVLKSNDHFTSIVPSKFDGFCLIYKIGRETKPRVGKIFVFKTLEEAQKFIHSCSSIKFLTQFGKQTIIMGEATNVSKIKQVALIPLSQKERVININNSTVQNFWKAKKQHKQPKCSIMLSPNNSFVCDSFLTVKEV